MTRFEQNIAGVPCVVVVDDLPPESLAFVIEYGIRQYLQDGAAVSKTYQSGEQKGMVKDEETIANEKREGVAERLENLRSGEFTRRGPAAPKMTPEERERDAIIMDRLSTWAKTREKRLPSKTGKNANPELLAQLKAAFYEKNKDSIDKEVSRRMRELQKTGVQDMTELDALLG